MSESNTKICPVCQVKIIKMAGGDRVFFSVGPAGSRETLWQKVCRHIENPGCINRRDTPKKI